MKENIASRVGRIISGSLNAIVDAVENTAPETVMQESIREIDSAIDEVRAELGRVVAAKHMANTRLMNENSKHESLSEKIELAVKEGRDDLAEVAIASQLDIEAQIPILEATIVDNGNQEKELEGYIVALQAKKREMQHELDQFRSIQKESSIAGTTENNASESSSGVERRVAKASSSFNRVMKNATGIGSSTSATDAQSAAQLAELDDMARKNRIQERLATVKKSNS